MAGNFVDITMNTQEFQENIRAVARMESAITPKWIKSTYRRKLKPMVAAMKSNSKSLRIDKMIGITTAKKRAGAFGAKVGVVKNDTTLFPKFSAEATAAVIEYGVSEERFRTLKTAGFTTGRQSTGTMPATPFLRPAWDSNVGPFMNEVDAAITQKIQKEAK